MSRKLYTILGIFKITLHLRDRHVFMRQSVEVLNVFHTLTLKQIFWRTKTFLKKLEYRCLVKVLRLKIASFSFKTAMSEDNVKRKRMGSTKCIFHKEPSFASNEFSWKFSFSFRISYKELIWCTSNPNAIFLLFVSVGVLIEGSFSL